MTLFLIHDKFLRRSLIKLGYEIINSAYVTNISLESILTTLETDIFNITNQNIPLPKYYTVNNVKLKVIDTDKIDYLPLVKEQVIHGLRFKTNKLDNKEKRIAKMNKAILSGFVRIAS